MAWKIDFFSDEHGRRPVEEFLDSLSIEHRAKIVQRLWMLEEWGPVLPFPYSSQIEGPLRELRAKFGNAQYRLLYYSDAMRVFVILHAFLKKTAEIPEQEKAIASRRMEIDRQRKSR